MSNTEHYSDEVLTGFLDGELDRLRMTAIKKALVKNEELKLKLEHLRIDRELMGDAFAPLLDMAPDMGTKPVSVSSRNDMRNRRFSTGWIAAVIMLPVLFAGLFYYSGLQIKQDKWYDYVAAYQALYVTNTLSNVSHTRQSEVLELQRVAKMLGRSFDITALKGMKELAYKRSQILGFQGKPLAQLTFLSTLGNPVALCLIRSNQTGDTIKLSTLENMASARWSKNGYEFLLIGGVDQDLISRAATHFKASL